MQCVEVILISGEMRKISCAVTLLYSSWPGWLETAPSIGAALVFTVDAYQFEDVLSMAVPIVY